MPDVTTRYAIGTLAFLLTGPICWAVHFTLLYASQSSLCAMDIGETSGGQNGLVVATIVIATILLGALALAGAWRANEWHAWLAAGALTQASAAFLLVVMRLLVAVSLVATTYAAGASLILPACAQLR